MKILYLTLLLFSPLYALCQSVSGLVANTGKAPLNGITITVKGTTLIAISDESGHFTISTQGPATVLWFTSAFTEPVELRVGDQKEMTVILQERVNTLDDVQVIAYGTNTQRNTVGSITKVSGDDINNAPITNPLAALQGRVPGLVNTSTSGLPGASFNVQIRGQNTLNPDRVANQVAPLSNPLFIIDGVPFAPQNAQVNQFASIASPGKGAVYNNAYGGISPFNSINPADIESIEVLRDADATAIYGSRGGNGVILITTKKGKAGKTIFNLNLMDGVSFVGNTMPLMNTSQYLAMRRQAFANDGLTPNNMLYDEAYAPDLTAFDTTKNTDWRKVFFGNSARNLNLNTSLSGGTANTQFHLGSGYNRDTYIFPGDFADDRLTFSANIHHNSENKKLTLDFSANYSYDSNNSAGDPAALSVSRLEPDYPNPVDPRGNLLWTYNGVPLDGSYAAYNPYAYLKEEYAIQNDNLNANLLVGYQIIDGLTLRSSFGYSTFYSQEYYGLPVAAQNPGYGPVAAAQFGNNNYTTWIIEPQLEYKKAWRKLTADILLGGTLQKETNYQTETDGSGYLNDDLIHSISGAPDIFASDGYFDYKYTALFGRLNLRWDNKYICNMTARRDGSSRFGPDRQFGNFGSVGEGWLFNEESFVKDNLPFLSYGKLRATYGITGSDQIANYQYLSRWAPTNYTYQGGLGYVPQNLYNPNFGWATTKKLEMGLELGFLKDRLLVNATWFRDRSGDQLLTYQLPTQTGFSNVLENWDAVVQNTGIELTLQVAPFKGGKFTWNSAFNLTIPKNKLLSFPNLATSSYATTYVVGQSLTVQEKFRSAGVDPATGYFQFYNAAGQVTATPTEGGAGAFNDYYNIGNLDPKFYGGWQNSFTYKDFSLDILLQFTKQMGLTYLSQVYSSQPGGEFNLPAALSDTWTTVGQKATLERLSTQTGPGYTAARYFDESDGVYGDASYIRFKTINLSYSLPAGFTKKLNVSAISLFAAAQNLFTITGYKGNDPETQNFYGVPPLKTITCGIQVSL